MNEILRRSAPQNDIGQEPIISSEPFGFAPHSLRSGTSQDKPGDRETPGVNLKRAPSPKEILHDIDPVPPICDILLCN